MLWALMTGLERAKLALDAAKVAIDGWAVIDERRRQRKLDEKDERVRELEERIAALEAKQQRRKK